MGGDALLLLLAVVVLVVGQPGAYGGARRSRPETVQATFGALVLLVATRLLVSAMG